MSRVGELREKVGLTQFQLAVKIGVTESTVANWEKGRSALKWFERVAKLCRELNCSPEDLVGYMSTTETEDESPV